MKKLIALLCAAALLSGMTMTACADVLWEPEENNFYDKHRNETEYVDEFYIVPDNGSANIYDAPDTQKSIGQLEGGEEINIVYQLSYDGQLWGLGVLWKEDLEGWVRMERLYKPYSTKDFARDHESEFLMEEVVDLSAMLEGDVAIWSYPNSGELTEVRTIEKNSGICCQYYYRDEQDVLWGYVGYFRGRTEWVCVDDPYNQELEGSPVESDISGVVTDPEVSETDYSQYLIAGAAVAAVVAVTAVMIVKMKKKQ